ncbi:MaoC family dehydratase [Gordonia sp. NPDC003424]
MTAIATTPTPYLDDLTTGDALPEVTYTVDQDRIDRYGLASLDLNPVHMDPVWAARAQVFGMPETVQHGMMSMSYMTSTVLRAFGPLTEITSVKSTFTKPVPVGTTIRCRGVVRDIHLHANGTDHAVIKVTATDDAGDTVGVSEISARLPRKP